MPLIKLQAVNENIYLAVWKITEDIAELSNDIEYSATDKLVYSEIKHKGKALEFVAGRALCRQAFSELGLPYIPIFRNEYGKPEMPNSYFGISLSHTAEFVVLAIGNGIDMGVDIEKPNEKMRKVAPRLFNQEEMAYCNEDIVHYSKLWSAKEVLYKIHMKREIDFKEHLFVKPKDKEWIYMEGSISKGTHEKRVTLQFQILEDYYICFNID